MGDTGVPVSQRIFGAGKQLRPNMIQPYKCKNVLIEGVTIKNSPMWHIHPVLSTNVTVRNVRVIGHGPNNDGCNPESSKDVLIEGCYFDTGDDCIAIKAGRNNDGRRVNVPSENIIIRNCQMKDGHGGVVIGSETSGGTRNVFAENCTMDSPNLERVLRIKTNSVRGGTIENIYMRNVKIGQVREAVLKVNFQYGEGDAGDFTPIVRNVNMENVTSQKSRYALSISGYEHSPITGVHLKNCIFDNVEKSNILIGVENLVMDNVKINGEQAK
jgi:polygalacturonase